MNPYEQLIPLLKESSIVANKTIILKSSGKEVVDGLWLGCLSILSGDRLRKIRDILPDGFVVTWFPNLQEIHIKTKQ